MIFIVDIQDQDAIRAHASHRVELAAYPDEISFECVDCGTALVSLQSYDEEVEHGC